MQGPGRWFGVRAGAIGASALPPPRRELPQGLNGLRFSVQKTTLHFLFRAVLLTASTTGGSPCGDPCSQIPAGTFTSSFPPPPRDAGVDADAAADAGAPVLEPDGGIAQARCAELCGVLVLSCRPITDDAGVAVVECSHGADRVCSGGGRRHAQVAPGSFARTHAVADYLAASAALEASSVLSFRRLRRELAHHGAPRTLLRAVSRAARDEARHARAMTSLARREGAAPLSAARVVAAQARGLEEIARENAVEGCVFETYGALLAMWQGENAEGAALRGSLRRIARDETRHAALAWSMARWAEQRLDRAAQLRVADARSAAVGELRRRVSGADPALVRRGLVPGARAARSMVDALDRALLAGGRARRASTRPVVVTES